MSTANTTRLEQLLPPAVRQLCETLHEHDYRAWIVGGCVRDVLLDELRGAPSDARAVRNDWDIATSARPAQVRRCFRRVIPTGIQHGTVTVLLDGVGYEVTTLRGETTYTDGRHPDSVFFVDDIRADLARRDFTINAMAYDPLSGSLIDPFGGMADLQAGLLRAVGRAEERFAEDGLRVLRAARFAATLEVTLDPETAAAIRPSLASYLKVSPERIRDEWVKALKARAPSQAFAIMQEHGLLEVTAPELTDDEVGWRQALRRVDAGPVRPLVRLAALLQDTDVATAEALLARLRLSNREQAHVAALVREHRVPYDPSWTDAAVRRFVVRVTPDLLPDLVDLARADAQSRGEPTAQLDELLQRAEQALAAGVALSTRDLAINGNDLMRELELSPGPHLGELLQELLDAVLEDPSLNDRSQLLARARARTLDR